MTCTAYAQVHDVVPAIKLILTGIYHVVTVNKPQPSSCSDSMIAHPDGLVLGEVQGTDNAENPRPGPTQLMMRQLCS